MSGNTAEQQQDLPGTLKGRQDSFIERHTQRLVAEAGAGDDGTTVVEAELNESPVDTVESEDEASGALSAEETDIQEDAELDEESPAGDQDEESTDWEKRYKDQEAELTRLQMSREADELEHAEAMNDLSRVRFELEDVMTEQAQRGEFLMQMFTANAQQYRNTDWSQVPPDQVAQRQHMAQQAFMQEQQMQKAFEQIINQQKEARDQMLRREAALARRRVTRTIPNFDETYPELGRYAASRGLNPKIFSEIVDPALMEMIYDSMQLRNAPRAVQPKKQPKGQRPRAGKTVSDQAQPRDESGRFKRAEKRFRDAKTSRDRQDAWQEKTAARLLKGS